MDILTDIPLLIGLIIATGFLLLGAVLIYMMFFADRPKKEKTEKAKDGSRFALAGSTKKGALVAQGRKLSKDEAAQAVYNRPGGATRPDLAEKATGFSFGNSAAEPLGDFSFPQATAEPSPSLPSAPPPKAATLPPRLRRPGQS